MEINKELEVMMSPSAWNPKKVKEQVLVDHVNFITIESEKCRQEIPCKLKIQVKTDFGYRSMDLYGDDLPPHSTLFFWVHGGYWSFGSKEINSYFAQSFYKLGIRSIIPSYTIAPEGNIKQMMSEIRSQLQKTLELWPNSNIYLGGHSAGAHLISQFLYDKKFYKNPKICGFLLFSGVYDLQPIVPTYINDQLGMRLTMECAKELSPLLIDLREKSIKEKNPGILILIGEYDSPEFKRQSQAYGDYLRNKFENVQNLTLLDEDHFTLCESLANPDSEVLKQVTNFLKIS